jgi:septum formation topological specificity factor MinE
MPTHRFVSVTSLCHKPELVPILREEIESVIGREGEVDYDNYTVSVKTMLLK